jgi:virginiamycin B lyase
MCAAALAALTVGACGGGPPGDGARGPAPEEAGITGIVMEPEGSPAAGVFVTARRLGTPVAHTVVTAAEGAYAFPRLAAGEYTIRAHRPDRAADSVRVTVGPDGRLGGDAGAGRGPAAGGSRLRDLRLTTDRVMPGEQPAAAFLGMLPDGEEKRRFILDCTGCHTFDDRIALPMGAPRTHAGWAEAVGRMLGFAGPNSGFPVIAAGREPEATAAYLSMHVTAAPPPSPRTAPHPDPTTAGALITEYDVPEPTDLPHDVAIDSAGRVLITGMFTARMYVLDAETGEYETIPIPVPNANPRAVEVDGDGIWWVLLGGPHQVARYDPDAGEWKTYPIGMYGHSLGPDANGRVWFNGHFTKAPELMGWIDAASGAVETVEVPPHPTMARTSGPIPYELRVAPDGGVWITELAGNRVIRFDPHSRRFDVHTMPTPHSGPRRIDVAADGVVWIPEYSGNRLARLDPATGAIREWELPIPDSNPYVARIDARTGTVWVGAGTADALFAFDPRTERFTTYRLPTRGALVRHITIDPRNGDVWAAYGASPGIPSKVARVRVR